MTHKPMPMARLLAILIGIVGIVWLDVRSAKSESLPVSDSEFNLLLRMPSNIFLSQAAAVQQETEKSNKERHRNNKQAPKMVVVMYDKETEDWAKTTLSKYDGLPILGPTSPNKRKRELLLRVQEAINELPNAPIAMVWDSYFTKANPPESPATKELCGLFAASQYPVVLAGWSADGPLDSCLHAEGPKRYQGHIGNFRDSQTHSLFVPLGKIDPRLSNLPNDDPFAVAAAAAILAERDRLPQEQAWQKARQLALRLAAISPAEARIREKSLPEVDIKGIRVRPRPIDSVSMKQVVLRDPAALEKLSGAIILVGNSIEDVGDIFGDQQKLPLCYLPAWTILQLLDSDRAETDMP